MNTKRSALLSGVLVLALASASSTGAPAPSSTGQRSEAISSAASLNEDIIDFALGGENARVREKLGELQSLLPELEPVLPAQAYEDVVSAISAMQTAVAWDDPVGVALEAVEVYRRLEQQLDSSARAMPVGVAMLDYSAFKLSALLQSEQLDWKAVGAAATESAGYWEALRSRIGDSGLRDLMGTIESGLGEAVTDENPEEALFAARLQSDAVDLLESYFLVQGSVPD